MILLVDDDETILRILPEILRKQGHEVHAACGGQEAIDLLSMGLTPDLILLDLRMPVVDGNAVLSYIQARQWEKQEPIVIVLTAYPGDFDKNHTQTVKGVYEKPLFGKALYDLVDLYDRPRDEGTSDDTRNDNQPDRE